MRLLAALVLALAVLTVPASAAGPPPLTFSEQGWGQIDWTCVEQQTIGLDCSRSDRVVNPTGCFWDVDDQQEWWAARDSVLGAGESVAVSFCLIGDDHPHLVGVSIGGSDPLTLSVIFAPQGYSFELYSRGCVIGPRYSTVSSLPEVAGSNGGHGVRTDVTVTVTNMGDHTVRKINGKVAVAVNTTNHQDFYCLPGPLVTVNPESGLVFKWAG